MVQNSPGFGARFGSRRAFGPRGRSTELCSLATGSRRLQKCIQNSHHGSLKGNSSGFRRNKRCHIEWKREECCNRGKRKSCLTVRDLWLHLGWSTSFPKCRHLGKKQIKFWHESNSRHVFVSAFLTTLIWHSHIADLWSCLMAGRNYSSCESDVRERKLKAPAWQPSQRKSTCFWINLEIKMIYCSSIISLEMWKSDSLCMDPVFCRPMWIHPLPQVISSPSGLYLKVNPTTQELRQRPESHVSPAAFIPETLQSILTPGSQGWSWGPASSHWWNHEPCQVTSALCSAPITWM